VTAPTPFLDFFSSADTPRDMRLLAARGEVELTVHELLRILVRLTKDPDSEVSETAAQTLARLPRDVVESFLETEPVQPDVRAFFASRRAVVDDAPAAMTEDLVGSLPSEVPPEPEPLDAAALAEIDTDDRETLLQTLSKLSFTGRLKAASRGSREVRAILIRDPNKAIASAVLGSAGLTEQEVETFARMPQISEDILRQIRANRVWMRNYGVVCALTRNPKTPLHLSMSLMSRLTERDLRILSTDRNVPEPLRIAARKRVVDAASR
jgi:hypothetical protein